MLSLKEKTDWLKHLLVLDSYFYQYMLPPHRYKAKMVVLEELQDSRHPDVRRNTGTWLWGCSRPSVRVIP